MHIIRVLAPILVLAGCASPPPPEPLGSGCAEPRPQVCTMEYDPVCADLVAGGRADYASPCNACADDAVAAYQPGKCPEPEQRG